MAEARVIQEHGTFRLVERGGRWAVVEARAGRLYPLAPDRDAGDGAPDTAAGLESAADGSWTDEDAARRRFEALSNRGDDLAQTIW